MGLLFHPQFFQQGKLIVRCGAGSQGMRHFAVHPMEVRAPGHNQMVLRGNLHKPLRIALAVACMPDLHALDFMVARQLLQ